MPPNIPPLDIKAEFASLQARFEEDPTQKTFNALIYGEPGSGKTFLLSTCRKPVLIDSFDKGGSKCLLKWINKGEILADTRWENEDPNAPTVYLEWAKEMNRRFKGGFFDHIGTYCIDSCTTWGEAIMNEMLRKSGQAGGVPNDFDKHWGPQKNLIKKHILKILSLPCDFILTGHLKPDYADKKREVLSGYKLDVTGDLKTRLLLHFAEIYVTKVTGTPDGLKYRLLTASTGHYIARSRLSAMANFEKFEDPDIKALLRKAGYPTEDKPLLVDS